MNARTDCNTSAASDTYLVNANTAILHTFVFGATLTTSRFHTIAMNRIIIVIHLL